MAQLVRIQCINKSDRYNHYERIKNVGGVNADGSQWKMSEDRAIAGIDNGTWSFYVSRGGNSVAVIVATSQWGHRYLKTVPDGEQPDNLLSLPECP